MKDVRYIYIHYTGTEEHHEVSKDLLHQEVSSRV